ncbi:DedA family protein [Actinoplanes sp. TBRC 11911]|uniref:DedA family protein n=1 Tax=Actinoplanes sp. TBRC 11911 TaxID=2729386 RepID=UPI00289A530C|nr:DedA family protein [Actinoplanes sp. TBRC 11911]
MLDTLLSVVDRFGYVGVSGLVFVESFGIPAPGETAIVAGAAAAGSGHLNVFGVAAAAFVAAVLGDSIGWLIGRRGGRPLVHRFGRYVRLTPARLDKVEQFMSRQGPKIVVVARFVEGLRQFNGIVSGMTGMRFLVFVTCNAIGAALWVSVWSAAGYFAGDHLDAITGAIKQYLVVAVAAAVVAVIAYVWMRRHRRRHT